MGTSGIAGNQLPVKGRLDGFDVPAFVIRLQDLLDEHTDVCDFFSELVTLVASELSHPSDAVSCGITVDRRKKSVAMANSDGRGHDLNELSNGFNGGPALTAMRSGAVTHVPDVESDRRWPEYMDAAEEADVGSILAIPLELKGAAAAGVLTLYSPRSHGFSQERILAAELVADKVSKSLSLVLKLAHLLDIRDHLTAALESRTTIDTAVGIIMAENRCSQEAALKILMSASNHRNTKLSVVARQVVSHVAGDIHVSSKFDE
ncbi:GAF and ANTAR domain-containing protein (plasmid) [Arthrobacter sp. D3-18]